MQPSLSPLPSEVITALQRGDKIEAIKLLRAKTGLGLKEAKDVVDGHESDKQMTKQLQGGPMAVPAGVMSAISRGNKLEAIKLLRKQTGLSLKEAKEAVEALVDGGQSAVPLTLAPGEVGKSGSPLKWLAVAVVLGAMAAYFFFKLG